MAHLPETSFCVIVIALLCMNLAKSLRRLLRTFIQMWVYLLDLNQNENFWVVAE